MDNSTSPYMRALMRVRKVKSAPAKPRKNRTRQSTPVLPRIIYVQPTYTDKPRTSAPSESLSEDPYTEAEILEAYAGGIYESGSQSYPDE